jgi:MFS family permease
MAIGPMIGLVLVSRFDYRVMFVTAVILAFLGFLLATGIRYPAYPEHRSSFTLKNLIETSSIPVSLVLFLNMITYGGVVSFISLYVQENGSGDAGIFFLLYAIGITISRLVSGKIFDTRGPALISISGFIMISIGFIVLALMHNTVGFPLSAFLMGLGGGVLFPTFQAMVNNLVKPNRRGAANSTLFTILDLGIGTGMLLTGFLAGNIGLTNAFLGFGVLNAIALVLFLTYAYKHYRSYKLEIPID